MSAGAGLWADFDAEKLSLWKEQGTSQRVHIEGVSGNKSEGEVFIKRWSQPERLKRALTWGGLSWAIALFCVLIPILHFVLVPLFLLVGPMVAYRIYKQESVVLGGMGNCPRCGKKLPIEKGAENWPLSDLCTGCQNSVRITRL